MSAAGALRRVLLLGSGLTSAPLVEYLTRAGDISVTVASNAVSQADHLANTYQNTTAKGLDVQSEENLTSLIRDHELVISHVPYAYHPLVAKHCLANNKSMVTSSYVSPAMQDLHQQAVDKGLVIVNEVGLDPGIDHMLAMQCFDEVHSQGGKIMSYESWCGGLPHPKYSNNPLKYKFSWSPAGVFLAAKNSAKFIRDGQLVEIAEGEIMDPQNMVKFEGERSPLPDVEFEGYYNRDSTKYVSLYNIPEAQTVIRGTYRYQGCCNIVRVLFKLGLLETAEMEQLQPGSTELKWRDLVSLLVKSGGTSVESAVGGDSDVILALEELGILSDSTVEPCGSPLKALCAHMEQRLSYDRGEQDAIYLHHFIGIKWPDNREEMRHINLTVYGTIGQFTAMAQTVGRPLAIATKLVLNGQLKQTGVVIPTSKEVYNPILDSLKEEGITAKVNSL